MSKERVLVSVTKDGRFEPYDEYSSSILRQFGYRVGDVLQAEFFKARDVTNWRRIHALATLVKDNIEGFETWDQHAIVKRLQLESGVECEEFAFVDLEGEERVGRMPKSLNFAGMGEERFQRVYKAISEHIIARYWPELEDAEAINEMLNCMPAVAA